MTNTRIDFKLNGRNLRTDLINITILLSFLTVCLIQTFQFSSILYFLIDVPILIMIALNLKKFTNVLLNRQVIVITVLLFLAFVFSLISCLLITFHLVTLFMVVISILDILYFSIVFLHLRMNEAKSRYIKYLFLYIGLIWY